MFIPIGTLALVFQVIYSCIPLAPPLPNSTKAPTKPASEVSEASEAPTEGPTTTTAKPTEEKETTKKPASCVTVELNPGRPCVFPFTYQYHQHHQCLPFKDKFWCALTTVYNKNHWGYCDQSLCPPTSEEQAVTPGPNTTTTTATTKATTMAEAWMDGSTTIAIRTMKTYVCQVDFQYSLQQGVKIKEISSDCSGSSSQSNDDVIDKLGNHKFSLNTAEGIKLDCEVGAVLLEDSKSLSEEVLTSSLKCEAVEADCVTVEGEVYPALCVIPFNYRGRRYLGCTDRPGSTKLWCPTKTDETGEAEDDSWGFCSRQCGYCGGSPITTRDGQEESCGYDCLLGSEWEMVGYDKAPLLKPTIDVSLPKEANYIAEKGGQHQLNIGPQSVTISCPDTKFYDPALQQQTSVQVKCGPEKYRLTVITESGATLEEKFKNDQFGCDPCPSSYSYVPGFLSSEDLSSNGIFYGVKTVQACKTLCEESCLCQTFYYSKQQSRCQLIKELIIKPSFSSSINDYVLCAKGEDEDLCGTNSALDATHLIAEKNWPYLSNALNKASHPDPAYKTVIFEAVTENGDIVMTPTSCPVSDPGLVSLFIAPSSLQCSADTLDASSTNGLHHLMISYSCDLDTTFQKFISDKDKFKQYFNGVPMKLCGARTWMKSVVAESRKTTLMDVFSFLYNTEATADSFDLDDASDCKSKEQTVKTMKTIFDNSDKVGFLFETNSGTEEAGFIKIPLKREPTTAMGITFVTTTFMNVENADLNDIVPYDGIITFSPNSDSASLFITIIQDNKSEADEFFHLELDIGKKRKTWSWFTYGLGEIYGNVEESGEVSGEESGEVSGEESGEVSGEESEEEIVHLCNDTDKKCVEYKKCEKDAAKGNYCHGVCQTNKHCIGEFNAADNPSCQKFCVGLGAQTYSFPPGSQCQCGSIETISKQNPICDTPSATCQNCKNENDCSHLKKDKHCFKNKCVECSSLKDKGDKKCQKTFSNKKPYCDTQKQKCFECFKPEHCTDTQVCNLNTNKCEGVECTKETQCTDQGFINCNKKNKCDKCVHHTDCHVRKKYTSCLNGECGMWMKCAGYTWQRTDNKGKPIGQVEPAMKILRKDINQNYVEIAHFHIDVANIHFRTKNCPYDQGGHSAIFGAEFPKVIRDCQSNAKHAWSLGDGNYFSKPQKETKEFWTPLTKDYKIPGCFFEKHQ